MKSKWLEILNKVRVGELSVAEGAEQIGALEGQETEDGDVLDRQSVPEDDGDVTVYPTSVYPTADENPEVDGTSGAAEVLQPDLGWWPNFWLIPFGIGTGIFILGAIGMGWAYSSQRFFWFYCAWLPMLFGLAVLLLGAWSRQARWVHVRVQNADGGRVAVSIPIPLRLGSLVLRIFGPYIPKLREQHLDQLPVVLDGLADSKEPMTVEVDDEDGSKVMVYIL